MARTTETKWIIGVDDKASKKLAKISGSFRALGKQTEALGKNLTKKFTAPVLAAVGAMGAMGIAAVKNADKMKKLSTRLGISTKALSEYKFIAEQAGITFETFTMGLQRMTRRIAEAAKGTGEAREALKELGVSATEIGRKAPEEQFAILADAIEGVKSPADKVRLAMKLFDSEGVSLIQMMKGGSEAMKLQAAVAGRLGIVIEDDVATAAENLTNKFGVLKNQVVGMGVSIAKFLIPHLNMFADKASLVLERIKNMSDAQLKFAASAGAILAALGPVLIIIGKITQGMPNLIKGLNVVRNTFLNLKYATIQAMLPMLAWVAVGAAVGVALLAIWANWGDDIKAFFINLWSNVTKLWGSAMEWLKEKSVVVLDKIGSAWGWLKDTIFKSMKPVLEWLLDAYSTVYGFILEGIGKVIQGFGQLLKFVAKAPKAPQWIKDMAEDVDNFGKSVENLGENLDLGEVAKTVFTNIKDAVQGGAEAIENFDWSNAWNNLSAGVGNQTELVKQQFKDMLNGLGLDSSKIQSILGGLGLDDTSGALTNQGSGSNEEEQDGGQEKVNQLSESVVGVKTRFDELLAKATLTSQQIGSAYADLAMDIGDTLGGALGHVWTNMIGLTEGPILLGKAFKKMAVNVIKNLATMVVKMLIVKAIASALGFSVGPLPSLSSIAAGSLAGAREKGGPVSVGSSYVVGEKGPEIFTPKTNGSITANDKIGSTSIANTIIINAEGNLLNDPLALRNVAEALNEELKKVQESYYDPDLATA